ncbi:MAG: cytochrome b5-like heme/steroid binding domain-containing protein [bacterium]|nr:cytochrome b5-like heme/steroid binding domain-containing protein [bacterium]
MKKIIGTALFIFWSVVAAVLISGLIFNQKAKIESNNSGSTDTNISAPIATSSPVEQAGRNSQSGSASTTPANKKIEPRKEAPFPPPPKPAGPAPLSAAGVAKHSLAGDCWLIVSGKVYDVTSYLSAHPGGAGTIVPYCGQEATQAFRTKDVGRPHSSYAESLLGDYYAGDLVK